MDRAQVALSKSPRRCHGLEVGIPADILHDAREREGGESTRRGHCVLKAASVWDCAMGLTMSWAGNLQLSADVQAVQKTAR